MAWVMVMSVLPSGGFLGRTVPTPAGTAHRQTYLFGDKVAPHGEQGGRGACRDADLGVDVLDVLLSGAAGDDQALATSALLHPAVMSARTIRSAC
jgi:hypothetical protein